MEDESRGGIAASHSDTPRDLPVESPGAPACSLPEGIEFGLITAKDGTDLSFGRVCVGEDTGRVLVFLHGIGSYGGLYYHMADPLRGAVDAVYFPDLRGHGRSNGRRGELIGRRSVLSDIATIVEAVRAENPACDVVLGGESMGGLLSLGYAAEHPDSIDALILAAPALKLNTKRLRTRDSIRRGIEGLRPGRGGEKLSGIPVTGTMPDEEPRDWTFVEVTAADPLILKSVSIKYLLVLATFIWNWGGRYPRRLAAALGGDPDAQTLPALGPLSGRHGGPLPVLILQGGADAVIDPSGARRLNDLIPQAEYSEFEESWHNLFWDPESPRVLARMADWLVNLGVKERGEDDEA